MVWVVFLYLQFTYLKKISSGLSSLCWLLNINAFLFHRVDLPVFPLFLKTCAELFRPLLCVAWTFGSFQKGKWELCWGQFLTILFSKVVLPFKFSVFSLQLYYSTKISFDFSAHHGGTCVCLIYCIVCVCVV